MVDLGVIYDKEAVVHGVGIVYYQGRVLGIELGYIKVSYFYLVLVHEGKKDINPL